MIVNNVTKTITLTEYDFTFVQGVPLTVTMNEDLGDRIVSTEAYFRFDLEPRPDPVDPDKTNPPETIVVYKQHLLAYQQRQREVTPLTPEQQAEVRTFLAQHHPAPTR
jgi:hypothetical protein